MVSPRSLADDPLRTLRAVRFAVELGFAIEPATARSRAASTPRRSRGVSPERVFAELKRVVAAPRVRDGLELMDATGLLAAVLPELDRAARRRAERLPPRRRARPHARGARRRSSRWRPIRPPPGSAASSTAPVAALLAEPLANELTRGTGLRLAALLHDVAKPQTRDVLPTGRVTFVGHDSEGAELARAVLRRLRASERLAGYVAGLTRHHLDLGFLVHERPLSRRTIWRYLTTTAPNSADVTLLTVADRLATRGRKAEPAIAAHLELAREMLGHAFALRRPARSRRSCPATSWPPSSGSARARQLGELLRTLEEDRFAGEISTREQAVARARELLDAG